MADLDTARMAIEAASEVLADAPDAEAYEQVAVAMHSVAGKLLKRAEKAEGRWLRLKEWSAAIASTIDTGPPRRVHAQTTFEFMVCLEERDEG